MPTNKQLERDLAEKIAKLPKKERERLLDDLEKQAIGGKKKK